jgi:hypothetical protein
MPAVASEAMVVGEKSVAKQSDNSTAKSLSPKSPSRTRLGGAKPKPSRPMSAACSPTELSPSCGSGAPCQASSPPEALALSAEMIGQTRPSTSHQL